MSTPAGSWQTKVVMGAKVKAALHLQTKVKLEACLPAALFSSLGETTCYERKHNCELSLVWVMKRTLRVAKHGLWQGIICVLKLQGTLLAPRRSPLLLPFPSLQTLGACEAYGLLVEALEQMASSLGRLLTWGRQCSATSKLYKHCMPHHNQVPTGFRAYWSKRSNATAAGQCFPAL